MGLVVDNFAGGGGASTGIEAALGRPVSVAINHWGAALDVHRTNHPETTHYVEDVFQVRPLEVTGGQPVDLAWFSPDCKHHSKAKGGKPVDRKIRGLAWVAVKWADQVRPRVIILENVEEFRDWGPLNTEGKPCKRRKGMVYKRFCTRLRNLGYQVEDRILTAADYGAPTTRTRLFLIARCDGQPITWPEPTHSRDGSADLFGSRQPWRTAAECIDWSIPCPSIFERSRPLAENTLKRIAEGLRRYVIEAAEPFIVGIDNKSSGTGAAWGTDEPLRTITQENRFALVCAFLSKHYGGVVGHGLRQPLGTITGVDHHSLTTAHLTKFYGTNIGADMRQPLPTITATGQHIAEVRALLVSYYGQGVGQSLRSPMRTITTKDWLGLVTIRGALYQIADIGLRMLQPHELALAQGFPADYILPANKSLAVALIGNSVCPPLAEALVRANLPEQAVALEVAA